MWHGVELCCRLICSSAQVTAGWRLHGTAGSADIVMMQLCCGSAGNILFSLEHPAGVIALASAMVLVHVLGSYQVRRRSTVMAIPWQCAWRQAVQQCSLFSMRTAYQATDGSAFLMRRSTPYQVRARLLIIMRAGNRQLLRTATNEFGSDHRVLELHTAH